MKVIIFNTLFYPNEIGGAELSVKDLAKKYKEAGFEVVVVSIAKSDKQYLYSGITCYTLAHRNLYWSVESKEKSVGKKILWHVIEGFNVFQFLNILKIIFRERPQIVHANNTAGFSIFIPLVCKLLGIKSLKTVRDYFDVCVNGTKFKNGKNCSARCLGCRVLTYTRRNSLSLYSEMSTISFNMKESLLKDGLKNAAVIYNGISQNDFPAISKNSRSKTIRFGFIGRDSPEKGLETLVSAFNILLEEFNDIKLIIAGSNKFRGCEKILSPGRMERNDFFNQIDVLIVPSLWNEPFGRVIIEAAVSGVPVVLSNRGASKELIEKGVAGILYDGSEQQLISVMRNIVQDGLISELTYQAGEAQSNITEIFSIEKMSQNYIKKLMEIYEDS